MGPFANIESIQQIPRDELIVTAVGGLYAGFLYWYEARKPWYASDVDCYARISDLHVVPSAQGKGVGRALVREAIARIHSARITTVFLETDEDNTRAQNLYQSEGFTKVTPGVVRFLLQSR